MLELALLGLLKERPMHGYDLRKRLREDFGPLANLSFGSLYPALARLERAGAVRAAASHERDAAPEPAAMVPLTGSLGGERAALVARLATTKAAAALGGHGGRGRKVYEITARGEELFEQLLEATEASGEDGKAFSLRLSFARYLSPASRVRLLERRRLQLADRLARHARGLAQPSRHLDAYERSIAEHARDAVASDLAWVEALLGEELAHAERPRERAGAPQGAGRGPHEKAGAGRRRREEPSTKDGHGETRGTLAPRVRTGAPSTAGRAERERNGA